MRTDVTAFSTEQDLLAIKGETGAALSVLREQRADAVATLRRRFLAALGEDARPAADSAASRWLEARLETLREVDSDQGIEAMLSDYRAGMRA